MPLTSMAVEGLVNILLSIIFIALSWYALQSLKIDLFLKSANGAQAKILQIFLSIMIGHGVTTFFMDYLGWSLLMKSFF